MSTPARAFLIHIAFLALLIAWLIFDVPYLDWVVGILYALRVIAAAILWCVSAIPEVTFARAVTAKRILGPVVLGVAGTGLGLASRPYYTGGGLSGSRCELLLCGRREMSPQEAKQLLGQRRVWAIDDAWYPREYTVTAFRATGTLTIEQDTYNDAITQIWCEYANACGRPSRVWFTPATFLAMPYAPGDPNRS